MVTSSWNFRLRPIGIACSCSSVMPTTMPRRLLSLCDVIKIIKCTVSKNWRDWHQYQNTDKEVVVCGPYVVTFLNWKPVFEWYMARFVIDTIEALATSLMIFRAHMTYPLHYQSEDSLGSWSNTTIIWTPLFEWSVVGCGSKKRHQQDECLEEIKLHAQNTLEICFSIFVIYPSNFLDSRLF